MDIDAPTSRFRRRALLFSRRRLKPGAPPGTLTADPEAPKPTLTAIVYDAVGFVEERELENLAALDRDDGLKGRRLWLNVNGTGDTGVMKELGRRFSLHPLALEDAMNPVQRPKVEVYPNHLFLVLRMARPWRAPLETEQVSLFLGDDVVISVQEGLPGDCFDPVRQRLRSSTSLLRERGSDYLAYALVDAVVDFGFPALETIAERLSTLEEEVLASPNRQHAVAIHGIRRELFGLRRVFWPLREALASMSRETQPRIRDDTRIYLRDTYDHAIQLIELVEVYRELSASLLDVYLSAIGQRTNDVMKALTLVATIFIPLGFIASLYGMNFDTQSPWNMPELSWAWGYPAVLALMTTVGVGLVLWFWRKGWLSS